MKTEQCQNCEHSKQVQFVPQQDDEECPYVWCSNDHKAVPKWSWCDKWEEKNDKA